MEGAGVEYFVNDLFLDVFHCLRYSCYNGCPQGNLRKITQCSCKANQPKKSTKTSDDITCVYNIYIYIISKIRIRFLFRIFQPFLVEILGFFRTPGGESYLLPCRSAIPEVLNSQSLFSELVGHTIWQPTLAPTSSSSTSLWPSLVRRFLGLHLCLEEEGSNWSRRLDFYK